MRHRYYTLATGTIALMLASCSADEPVAKNTSDSIINYAVAAANQSRAANSYCAKNKPGEFHVWAEHKINSDATTYINGDRIAIGADGTYTDVDGIRYWPSEGTLSFYAIADSDSKFNFATKQVNNYIIKSDVKDQLDLMYAVASDLQTNTSPVNLNFRHALSQICFQAKNENPNSRITINSIAIGGTGEIVNKGTYTLPSTSTEGNITTHSTTDQGDTPTRGSWTLSDTDKTSYQINSINKVLNDSYLDFTATSDHSGKWYTNVLNLIPQQKNGLTVTLNVKIENKSVDKNGNVTYKPVNNNLNVEVKIDIDWREGNRYIYAFNFHKDWSPTNLNAVKYNVTIDDFIDNPKPEIIVDGHNAVLMRKASGSQTALYFATTNILPEDIPDNEKTPQYRGLYFWWGDIEGHKAVTDESATNNLKTGDDFDFSGNNKSIATYDKTQAQLQNAGYLDGGDNLNLEHDAAHKLWKGSWRMPTKEDFQWLIDHCTWKAVTAVSTDPTKKQVVGFDVTSNTTGGQIYLPAASCFENGIFGGNGDIHTTAGETMYLTHGFYWTSTVTQTNNPSGAVRLHIKPNADGTLTISTNDNEGARHNGFPIRPVSYGFIPQ